MANAQSNGTIDVLQAGRALAAFAVVLHHAVLSTEGFIGPMPEALRNFFWHGYLGVDFFFVLSGFIIYYTSYKKPRSGSYARTFLVKRLVRIYTPYLPISFVLIAAYTLVPGFSQSEREWGWAESIFLWPGGAPPALNIAWTLQHELIFYGLFGVFLATNVVWKGMAIWMTVITVAWIAGINSGLPMVLFLGQINLEFMMGMLLAHRLITHPNDASLPYLIGAALAFGAFLALGAPRELSVLFGFAIACLLGPLVGSELRGTLHVPRWMVALGDASYALYLIHNPLLSVTSRIAAQVSDNWALCFCVGVTAPVLASMAYYRFYERPTLDFLTRRLLGKRSSSPPTL